MGFSRDTQVTPVRRPTALPDFSSFDISTIKFREHESFAGLKVFTCERLNAVLTADSCAANYTRANQPASCKGCSIGLKHSGGSPMKETQHEVPANQQSLSCIRCERTEATATKYIGRFRIVKRQHCINCFNREREVIKGTNGKGAKPVKHAGLRQATITIRLDGKIQEHDIGLRWSRQECERYVERIIPGAELLQVEIDGELILPDAPVPAVKALGSKPVQPAKPKANKPLRVASDREAFSNDDDDLIDPEYNAGWFNTSKPKRVLAADKRVGKWKDDRNIIWNKRPLESDDDLLVLDQWPTLAADTLPQFVTWLASDWPTLASEARAAPSEVRAPIADSEAVVSPAWREVFGDLSEQPIKRACKSTWDLEPDLSPEEDAAYRASFDSEPVATPEPLADIPAIAAAVEPKQTVVVDSGKRMSPKLAKKAAAREARLAHKQAADAGRAKEAKRALPQTRATQGAIAARGAALVAQYLYHKHTLTKPGNASQS